MKYFLFSIVFFVTFKVTVFVGRIITSLMAGMVTYYLETGRGNTVYRLRPGRTPEFASSRNDDPDKKPWNKSKDYPTRKHLLNSITVNGDNWAVMQTTRAYAKKTHPHIRF